MYFSKIEFASQALGSGLGKARMGYGAHQLLWDLFSDGPDRERDFIFRQEEEGRLPFFYCVSSREPQGPKDVWRIRTKGYQPRLSQGQRLFFSLRVNPVVSRRDSKGRQQRHDVVADLKTKLKKEGPDQDGPTIRSEMIRQAGLAWLEKRGPQNGFAFEPGQVAVEGYRRQRFRKFKSNREITFSSLDFSGLLTITDTDLFSSVLFKGLGPAKGFGCGLMLVRRA